jgi:hypothetical protein
VLGRALGFAWRDACRLLPARSQEPSSIQKIMEIDTHTGCAMSGLTADAKTLIDHARTDTQVEICADLKLTCVRPCAAGSSSQLCAEVA